MRKFSIIFVAALLVVALALPAAALENIFGGYWRTRIWSQQNMSGDENDDSLDYGGLIDTRTRLYYTAVFSENFSFVNKFEFDADWGDNALGDIGADGKDFEIKNSYVDFRMGDFRSTIGIQGVTLARGFVLGDDISAAIIRYQPGTTKDLLVPFIFAKIQEKDSNGDALSAFGVIQAPGTAVDDVDVDLVGLYPFIPMGDFTLNPYFFYVFTGSGPYKESDWYYVGLDVDGKIGDIGLWGSLIYNGGTIDRTALGTPDDVDISAFLAAVGVNGSMGPIGYRGQIFYASGQDPNNNLATGDDIEAFVPLGTAGLGSSYYWSEILGLGVFDDNASAGSPGDHITDILAAGIGATFQLTEKVKLDGDVWYAQLAEDNFLGDKDLGVELDAKVTINLVENLNLELIGAYLMAGDATTNGPDKNKDDPYIVGSRLSFSF